jgi:Protein of unknwon function (DUF3310)
MTFRNLDPLKDLPAEQGADTSQSRGAAGSVSWMIGPIANTKIDYKYSEDKILADLKSYIDKTYGQHYKSEDQDIQCLDAWIAMGDATPTFRNTAMKYLWRYGKKNGNNKDDLMKALHYIFFALHNDHYKGTKYK